MTDSDFVDLSWKRNRIKLKIPSEIVPPLNLFEKNLTLAIPIKRELWLPGIVGGEFCWYLAADTNWSLAYISLLSYPWSVKKKKIERVSTSYLCIRVHLILEFQVWHPKQSMYTFFETLFFLKLCPLFVGSLDNLGKRYEKQVKVNFW